MPNHWESSARPLFVKTVFVNGSRHAILFEKDPLLRCVNSPIKKTSRPNSSLSFASGLSISSSEESQITNSECKTFKLKNIGRSQEKDLSSELQSCLIKFKLASSSFKNKNNSREEKCFFHSKAEIKGKEYSKQKSPKGNRDKNNKRCEHFFQEQNEYKLTEIKNSENKSCYIYNLENHKRRKNYSFVKITSQPPQFFLNCSCENNWNETHKCNPRNKNNLVISASIKNLVMTPDENIFEKTLDYVLPFENSELNWNNYITKSYYNSLAERVFQWLDLARKRKKPPEKLTLTDDSDCGTSIERIYSGKKFAEEIKKNENLSKFRNKSTNNIINGKLLQSDTSEEEIEEKVIREQNVETLLSLENESRESSEKTNSLDKVASEVAEDKPQQSDNFLVKSPPLPSPKESIFNIIKTPLKIQNLIVNSPSKESTSSKNLSIKKIKEPRNVSSRQNKKETIPSEEERDLSIAEKGRGVFPEKSDAHTKQHSHCYCSRNLDKYGDDINSQILTEEFAERNQKSINNLNITRSRPALIQNLSPQQHDKISLEEERIVWASEKSTGRPQLHIFMPNVLLKDQSDDSMSECETFFNL